MWNDYYWGRSTSTKYLVYTKAENAMESAFCNGLQKSSLWSILLFSAMEQHFSQGMFRTSRIEIVMFRTFGASCPKQSGAICRTYVCERTPT